MVTRDELRNYCDQYLSASLFKDYCPNGLQVEGRSEIRKIVTGVTACQSLIDAAVEKGADAIFVHHGYFWRGEAEAITGMKYQRISRLIKNDVSLFGYHLPLDAHPTVGNNVELGRHLGLQIDRRAGKNDLVCFASLDASMTTSDLTSRLSSVLQREPLVVGSTDKQIRTIAWCTGGAQSYIDTAIEYGADAFISGEISENTVHAARECGIAYFAAGHHATERYGVQALGAHLSDKFSVEHEFVDIVNPV